MILEYSKKIPVNYLLKEVIMKPLIAGCYGFTLFFLTVVICQIITVVFDEGGSVKVELSDVYFSLLGFGLAFLIRLFSNIAKIKGEN